jgi:hypothetical protein
MDEFVSRLGANTMGAVFAIRERRPRASFGL